LYTDTHCHLYLEHFDADREEVLKRAGENGVNRILIPGIDLDTSSQAGDLSERYEPIYAAVGVHPNNSLSWTDDSLIRLHALTENKKVVAIGEIGLDYYWESAPIDVQKRVFRHQLELALKCDLPVVVHLRDRDGTHYPARRDILAILKEWVSEVRQRNSPLAARPGVLHSFSGDLKAAQEAYDLGFSVGISGPVTFKKADQLREIVYNMPLTALQSETDSPFLTPHPFRGKRNEPAYVRYVTEEIIRLRQEDEQIICDTIESNAQRLFHW
jgi:TatD DNase family protein